VQKSPEDMRELRVSLVVLAVDLLTTWGQVKFQVPQIRRMLDLPGHLLCFLNHLVKLSPQGSAGEWPDRSQTTGQAIGRSQTEHARRKKPPADVVDAAEDHSRPLNRGTARRATQTIRQFAENLFFPMLERQVRQSTLKGYARWGSQLLPRCGDLRLRDLTALSAQRIIDDVNRQNPKMKRSSLLHLKNLLSLIFDEALRLGCADAARGNPARRIKIPRSPEGDETHCYSLRDVETMLAVLPEPPATLCAAAAFAGLRRSELRGVRGEDSDGEQIMVMRSSGCGRGMPQALQQALRHW
jgi:integrase